MAVSSRPHRLPNHVKFETENVHGGCPTQEPALRTTTPPTVAMVDVWGFGKTPFFERVAGRYLTKTVGKNRCALHNNENTWWATC